MNRNFIQAENGAFYLKNTPIILRGFAVGSWMNLESFMFRIPGTEKRIRETFTEVYGEANANQFFDDFLANTIAEDDFILLKSLGINVLRFPFNYRHFEDDQAPGVYKPEGFKHLDRVLDLCRKYEIFAILDLHSSPGGQNPDCHGGGETGISGFWQDASSRERMINLWGHIAQKYKADPIIAGYDVLNEPCYVSDRNAFNAFYALLIKKIRSIDHHHIIFLEGEDWAKDFSIFNQLGGHQQALSFHFYPGQHVYLSTKSAERKVELEKKLSYFLELRAKTGMPLWVGETGGNFPAAKFGEGMSLIKECLDLFEKYGISWTLWSYKDAGAMGMIHPKETTPWISLANDFSRQWQAKERSHLTLAKEIFAFLEQKYSYTIDDALKEQLKFRIFALLHELHIHQFVKPKLMALPWDEIKDYPQSFRLENCDGVEEMANLVMSYTSSEKAPGPV